MSHMTKVNGTTYEITGGKTLVDGTAYNISSGKTLVSGTEYEIGFKSVWHKYSCDMGYRYDGQSSTPTQQFVSKSSGNGKATIYTYDGYGFSDIQGFYGTGNLLTTNVTSTTTFSDLDVIVGRYFISSELEIHKIESLHFIEYSGYPRVKCNTTKFYTTKITVYNKGTVSYGTIKSPPDELPEDGTLVSGSVMDGYYVLQIDSTYYYYELEV